MSNKEIQLYLALLDKYLNSEERVYDYGIQSMLAEDEGVCFAFYEIDPLYRAGETSILIFTIRGQEELSILNVYGKDCIYDYLEENEMTKEEADREMAGYKKLIRKFRKSENLTDIYITRYHTTAFYPYLLFEYEAVLGNSKKVYFNFNIELNAEKKGLPILYKKDMEYWCYDRPVLEVEDETSQISLGQVLEEEILKKGIELWNDYLGWQEDWTVVKQ